MSKRRQLLINHIIDDDGRLWILKPETREWFCDYEISQDAPSFIVPINRNDILVPTHDNKLFNIQTMKYINIDVNVKQVHNLSRSDSLNYYLLLDTQGNLYLTKINIRFNIVEAVKLIKHNVQLICEGLKNIQYVVVVNENNIIATRISRIISAFIDNECDLNKLWEESWTIANNVDLSKFSGKMPFVFEKNVYDINIDHRIIINKCDHNIIDIGYNVDDYFGKEIYSNYILTNEDDGRHVRIFASNNYHFDNDSLITSDSEKSYKIYSPIINQMGELSPWVKFVRINNIDLLLNKNGNLYQLIDGFIKLTHIPPKIFEAPSCVKKTS